MDHVFQLLKYCSSGDRVVVEGLEAGVLARIELTAHVEGANQHLRLFAGQDADVRGVRERVPPAMPGSLNASPSGQACCRRCRAR